MIGNRTWPVFTIGLGALLLLIFLPGLAALRQSSHIYDEIRAIQSLHEKNQQDLFDIERYILQMSVTVRDFLLDSSPETASTYRRRFQELRSATEVKLIALSNSASQNQLGMFDHLRQQLRDYGYTLQPVLDWTPQQRAEQATYFLREQQRPRRQAILSIADEIRRLNATNFRRRYEDLNTSQLKFRNQLQIAIGAAFLIGLAVAAATIYRISTLERHNARERAAIEHAEHELRSLSARLMNAQEEERRTISRELHDEVGQLLTALRMELGMIDKLAHSGQPSSEHILEAKSLAEQTLRIVRDIAVGLRPSVLDLGLEPALQWQMRHFARRTGTEVSVDFEGQLPPLPDVYLTCIYRIVQEALTNSARHAHARAIVVKVAAQPDELHVTVKDDGVGLPQQWTSSGGLGLIGIEERARELGGAVSIESQNGVSVHVRLPLPKGAPA